MSASESLNATSPPPVGANVAHEHRIDTLDGVRGLAILLVMLFHYEVRRFDLSFPGTAILRAVINFGWAGVDLFFVLSGFLITGVLWRTRSSRQYFRSFYVRRVLRIFPLYYAYLIIVLLVLPIFGVAPSTPVAVQLVYWTHTSNYLVAIGGWAAAAPFTPHLWSLAVEEQFYLIWPLVLRHLTRANALAICAVALLFAPVLRWLIVGYPGGLTANDVLTPTRIDGLAVGAGIALLSVGPLGLDSSIRAIRFVGAPTALALIALIAVRGSAPQNDAIFSIFGFSLVAIAWGWLVAEMSRPRAQNLVARFFRARSLQWVGRRSYAMYVLHHPLLTLLPRVGFDVPALRQLVGRNSLAHVLFLSVNVALTAGAAQLSWVVLEQRFLALKDQLAPVVE